MSGGDTYEDRVHRAKVLVEDFFLSAIDFLAANFNKAQLEEEIKKCCTRQGQEFGYVMFRQRSGSNQSQGASNVRPSFSPPNNYILPHGQFQSLQQPLPSPPTSSASEFSPSGSSAREPILAFDEGYQEQPLSMVRANVRHNWIRGDVVCKRLRLPIKACDIIGGFVSCPYAAAPNGVLHATQQVVLTWRKRECDDTEQNVFYLVHERMGADVLLGDQVPISLQANMNGSPSPHPLSPHPQRQVPHSLLAPTGTWAQTESHASAAPTVTGFVQHMPGVGQPGLNIFNGQPTAANYQIDSWRHQSSSMSQTQVPSPAVASASVTPTQTAGIPQHVRIMVKWDRSSLGINVNLSASEEMLCAQLERAFTKRTLDRSAFRLRLSTDRDPDAADGDEAVVSLNENDLQYDWQEAVDWIKTQGSSRVYAKIEPVDSPS